MIAFLGHHLDKKLLQADLEALLLTDAEMKKLKRAMAVPWPGDGSPRDDCFEDPLGGFGDINQAVHDYFDDGEEEGEEDGEGIYPDQESDELHDGHDDHEHDLPPRYDQKLPPVFDDIDISVPEM